jgi:subtilisin family serine protease
VRRRALVLAAVAALAVPAAAAAFANTEPLAAKQWYLTQVKAWDHWDSMPQLYPVKVAIVDSGVDGTNPDLAGRVVAARSFVGGSPYHDLQGHGTFVAGEIAANPSNALGIAGLAFNARLVVAKVVTPEGDVPVAAEVAGIRWAADQGARVINLSLGGVRDPIDPSQDTYSPLEQAAVDYAYAKGAVVVAAVGNGPQSPSEPWPYAAYPAALPHVIGVSATRQNGSVPDYSNRDAIYDDLAAPGDAMLSTVPQALITSTDPGCQNHPWSDCGPDELKDAIGTSFAAPLVSAAAALILGEQPTLTPDQVAWLLERGATDATPATGCAICTPGRDAPTGWGLLNVDASLSLLETAAHPPPDRLEPNDDAGPWSHAVPPLPRTIAASLDFWDDDVDVYRVTLRKGQSLFARLTPSTPASVALTVWAPGTQHVAGIGVASRGLAHSRRVGGQARVAWRATTSGTYYVEARLASKTRDPVQYRLALTRKAS